MSEQIFGPCRSRATTKPRQAQEDPVFYRCKACGRVILDLGNACGEETHLCCGEAMERLEPKGKSALPPGGEIDYQIVGGFNNNAVKLSWFASDSQFRPRWVYLKNYTGGQFKWISDSKRSPVIFPLADEDAYSYCDEDPCLECVFCCKLGFSFFVYFKEYGLITLPIDRKRANWQSSSAQTGPVK